MTIHCKEQKSTRVGLNKESEISGKCGVAGPHENWSLDPAVLSGTEAAATRLFGLAWALDSASPCASAPFSWQTSTISHSRC